MSYIEAYLPDNNIGYMEASVPGNNIGYIYASLPDNNILSRETLQYKNNMGCIDSSQPDNNILCIYENVSKFSGLAAWSENCKWYNSLTVGAVL
jgi:hypothetical protein